MAIDTQRARAKEQEIETLAASAIDRHCRQIGSSLEAAEISRLAHQLLENYVRITAPEKEEPVVTVDLIVMRARPDPFGPDFGSARQVKPGNIRLNMGKLATAAAGGVLTAVGVAQAPWTLPFAALVIWESLWAAAKVELSEREAAVLWTMWARRDESNCVPAENLLEQVNSELQAYRRDILTQDQLHETLRILEKMGCLARSKQNPNRWWLREWVRITFK